eukprot:363688-Chlamydomonas_euryale.AAC.1
MADDEDALAQQLDEKQSLQDEKQSLQNENNKLLRVAEPAVSAAIQTLKKAGEWPVCGCKISKPVMKKMC